MANSRHRHLHLPVQIAPETPEISYDSITKKTSHKTGKNQDPAWTKYLKTLSIMDWLQQIKISLLHPFQKLKFYEVISDDKSGIRLTWESENICNSQSGPLLSLPNNPHPPSWSPFWWAWKDFDIDTGLHTQSIYSSIVRRIYCNPQGFSDWFFTGPGAQQKPLCSSWHKI